MDGESALERLHDACAEGNLEAVRAEVASHAEGDISRLFCDPDEDGQTALHHACSSGDVDVTQFVLDKVPSGSINKRDNHDMSPFHLACENGHLKVVELLVARSDLDRSLRCPRRTSFFLAQKHEFTEICELLERMEKEDLEKERG